MSQKKMLRFSTAVVLLLLPWLGDLVIGELSTDFSQCLNFFYKEIPPQGISIADHQPICQRYKNQYRFATLYHRQHRAPLYSAYILSPPDGKRPEEVWKYEPQLENSCADPEMKPFTANVDQNVIESQAVITDYTNSGFTRGHLNPSGHHMTVEDRDATFTLTNIVPQQEGSNSGTWSIQEGRVLKRLQANCQGLAYVITGVMPYKSKEHWMKKRVFVPEYLWSAYCCPSSKPNLPKDVRPFFPTYAAVGRNDPNSGEEIVPVKKKAKEAVRGYDVREMSLEELEGVLSKRLNTKISLFFEQCK